MGETNVTNNSTLCLKIIVVHVFYSIIYAVVSMDIGQSIYRLPPQYTF